jgi:pilus assembly protein CpaB
MLRGRAVTALQFKHLDVAQMWIVKRMNTARIGVMTIALGAGGVAAYLASRSDDKPLPPEPVAQLRTVDVLVAKSDIGLGQTVTAGDLQWQTWPASTASNSFIRRSERPEATKEVAGSIARAPFIGGEPIREPKLVRADGSGFMAAILPAGMRAISTDISPETGAGGFILPNDRVDLILSKREKNPDRSGSADIVRSEVVLSNIRVLAIDQAPKEKDGQNSVIGKTVTLELKPEQSETLVRARQSGTLSLALRSIADLNVTEPRSDDQTLMRGNTVNVVRYGVSNLTTVQK